MDEQKLLEDYVKARNRKEANELILKDSQAELDACEDAITSFLESSNKKDTGMYPNLGKVSITVPRVYASCLEENKERCFNFLRASGRDDLIKETVNAASLSSFTKALVETGQEVPDCITYYLKPSIKFTRS